MFDLDTRLLQIFFEIYKHSSVSKAAEQLEIGQPTLSIALNKLREHFQDPLFVRIENKMQPTELSKQIYPLVVEILNRLKLVQNYNIEFDPQTSNYQFKISMTDISHLVLLPKLINYLRAHAPNIRLEIIPIDANTPVMMSNGDIDLAIGFCLSLKQVFINKRFSNNVMFALLVKNTRDLQVQRFQIKNFAKSYMSIFLQQVDTTCWSMSYKNWG